MRNRRKQRTLKRAGIPREEPIPAYNAEHYADPVPRAAVASIRRREKGGVSDGPIAASGKRGRHDG